MKRAMCLAVVIASLGLVFGPPYAEPQGRGKGKSHKSHGHEKGKKRHPHGKAKGHDYFRAHGYERLEIPPGHYPPPGQCRLWFPDRPPGHQPPPGRCSPVPRGAWLIRHPRDLPDHVLVHVYAPRDPTRLLVVGQFEISSGLFVRVVLDR